MIPDNAGYGCRPDARELLPLEATMYIGFDKLQFRR